MRSCITAFFAALCLHASAQNATRDRDGNYHATAKAAAPTHDSTTTWTFTDREGKVFPVYVTAKGYPYVWRISKRGGAYRYYIRTEGKGK